VAVTHLYDFAADLLAVCEEALATTPGGVPDRSFITVAQPALDCPEQLTVHVVSLEIDQQITPNQGATGGLRFQEGWRNLATFMATIVRCTPQPNNFAAQPPSTTDLDLLAQKTSADLWAIWNSVAQRLSEGTLFEGCSVTSFRIAVPQVESGTSAGWQFIVTTAINGYSPL
jgi:hypothetical protein